MKHIDLFSGIGGFALAADRVWGNVEHIFCDNDPFCQQVLRKHWPTARIHGDIRTFTNTDRSGSGTPSSRADSDRETIHERQEEQPQSELSGQVDLLTGGFPCQPFSQAGRRRGTADDRYLWPEMFRVIQEFQPRWVIAENVRGLVTWSEGLVLEQVCTDLESEGYEVQPIIIPAVAVNAPHRRDRVWIIAHSLGSADGRASRQDARSRSKKRLQERHEVREPIKPARVHAPDTRHERQAKSEVKTVGGEQPYSWDRNWIEVAAELCGVDDGLPKRLDRNPRLKALGNAIVPQVAEEIMRAITKADE